MDVPKELGIVGVTTKIITVFKINTEGNIVDVRARGGNAKLEEEAIRVIKTIPQMIPGKHEGKIVSVLYELPITCLLYTSPSPRDQRGSRMPSSA